MKTSRGSTILRVVILLVVLALMTLLVIYRDQIDEQQLMALGYPGLFILTFLSNASILIPVPGWIAVSVMAALLNPLLVALVAAVASALGEFSGYLIGFSGQTIAERGKWYDRLEYYMKRWGGYTVMALAVIPLPLIDLGGVIAGALKMSPIKFFGWCFVGKFIKFFTLAIGGDWFLKLINF
ncbi:MAG TPA: VTT domain-containing protein [Anaerolineaceae bacterium]|nr:VTT domain-containing protein [Anaerolineaceae bacterium]